jgi:predicted nuclease with TOPRIM domain
MTMTDKELKLLDDWIALHREIEKLEAELDTLADKLKKVSRRLYAGKSRAMLEEFSAFLDNEIKKLDRKKDRERINQLKSLQKLVAHDIYIDTLVEQDIDIEEQGTDIDLADYRGD